MKPLILIRHGQSQWNKENRFTGWVNVDLAENGISEAIRAGQKLKDKNYKFDDVYTSKLLRAQKTASIVLKELDSHLTPIESWRLNERHYGDLQGKNKAETAQIHGDEQVHIWRRSYDTPPPPLPEEEAKKLVEGTQTPAVTCESLKDTYERTIPYWKEEILPKIKQGHKILIVAHGNSLRALMKYIFNISDQDIVKLEIPTGVPIECSFDENFNGKDYEFLN